MEFLPPKLSFLREPPGSCGDNSVKLAVYIDNHYQEDLYNYKLRGGEQ